MRLFWVICGLSALAASAQTGSTEAWQLEAKGDGGQAREHLQKAAEAASANPSAIRAYAQFLDQHRDPAARQAYARLERALIDSKAAKDQLAACARREAILDLLAGDRPQQPTILKSSATPAVPRSRYRIPNRS